ncbi:hypothetical protein [Fusobacterium necrophorum]|uniref:hypothetical protein n=1 Tax=Fusobacterium necrophorum TaxID=859 RepID=UPI00370E2D34
MSLNSSGRISLKDIAKELGKEGKQISFNDQDVLTLAGKTSGQQVVLPDDFWGKSVAKKYILTVENKGSMYGYHKGNAIGNLEPNELNEYIIIALYAQYYDIILKFDNDPYEDSIVLKINDTKITLTRGYGGVYSAYNRQMYDLFVSKVATYQNTLQIEFMID